MQMSKMTGFKYLGLNQILRIFVGMTGLVYGLSTLEITVVGDVLYYATVATITATVISFGLDQKLLIALNQKLCYLTLIQSVIIRSCMLIVILCSYQLLSWYNWVDDKNGYLLFIIFIYFTEIFNGAREYHIASTKYKELFYYQILSITLQLVMVAVLHQLQHKDFAFIVLSFGGKLFFNIALFLHITLAQTNLHKNFNTHILYGINDLIKGGLLLLSTALILQINVFVAVNFIESELSSSSVAIFGLALRGYMYVQMPINILLTTQIKKLLIFFDGTDALSLRGLLRELRGIFLFILSVLLISGTAVLVLPVYLSGNFIEYYDVAPTFFVLTLGLLPYVLTNVMTKFAISKTDGTIISIRSSLILILNTLLLYVALDEPTVLHVALVILATEVIGMLVMLAYLMRLKDKLT